MLEPVEVEASSQKAPLGFDARDFRPKALKKGSRVLGGTILGRLGAKSPKSAPYLKFEIRPAGRGAPRIAELAPILERARPRPVTPYYDLISDVLQSEFSAAVTGIRTPARALGRAQGLVDHLMGVAR